MPRYRLLLHKDYERSVRSLPSSIRQKALWAQVLLGTRGRTPSVKGTSGLPIHWRRTPVQGNHFYMWWVPQSESGLTNGASSGTTTGLIHGPTNGSTNGPVNGSTTANGDHHEQSILIHSVRHHDQTGYPIELGHLDDYEEIHVADLDPRFEEQKLVSEQVEYAALTQAHLRRAISLSTIKGLPGSGKTISLLYLVRDVLQRTGSGKILYITYTPRLKRAAEEFLLAQDESFAERIQLKTLSEVQSEFTGLQTSSEPFQALNEFCKFLDLQNTSTLGPWRRYPQALYTEIRAHLLGREFPQGYRLLGEKVGEQSTRLQPLSAESYAKMRKLDPEAADIAYKVSVRAAASRFFQEQKAAQRSLEVLIAGKMPSWLPNLSGVIVDEVQDLTLLQLAFLGEMVRTAVDVQSRRQAHTGGIDAFPFVFTVAGDESQIVQPTGFDWGVTKEMLGLQLETTPEEFEFQHQRRSPRVLAGLIEASWNLYGFLPKSHRPSARHDAFIDESVAAEHTFEDGGRVLLCGDLGGRPFTPAPSSGRSTAAVDTVAHLVEQSRFVDWGGLFDEMVDKPGRILIDLTENLRSVLSGNATEMSNEVLFLSREIKGLERSTVIIYGLNAVYERAMQLCEDGAVDNIPRFEARRLFDEIRVALSRSTHTLVLMEPPSAPVLPMLGIEPAIVTPAGAEISTVSWDDLIDILRTEEMSELEAIEGYLDEVDDLMERGRWAWAYRRNRRAYALAVEIMDLALQREANNQHIEIHFQEAASLFTRSEWAKAYKRNRDAHALALALGDPEVLDRVDDQLQQFRSTLSAQVEVLHNQALNWIESKSYKVAYRDAKAAYELAEAIQDEVLLPIVGESYIYVCTRWAYQLTDGHTVASGLPQARSLLQEAIAYWAKEDPGLSNRWRIILERYATDSQVGQLSTIQFERVLTQAAEWAGTTKVAPLTVEKAGVDFILRWLDELFHSLDGQLLFFYDWAAIAEQVIEQAEAADFVDYAWSFDDYLWDLENQVEQQLAENPQRSRRTQLTLDRFAAFMLGYHGHAAEATVAWEALGNFEEAGRQARFAGQLEKAYELLRHSRSNIPEELAISVKALRLLAQLETKHQGLTAAEKETLRAKLAAMQETLVANSDDDTLYFEQVE